MPIADPRRLEITYAEVRSQLLHDGTRAMTLSDLTTRYRAVLEAELAVRRGEAGAMAAKRQALIDLSTCSMELVARERPRPARRQGVVT